MSDDRPLGEPIPLTTSSARAQLHLSYLHTLDLDESGENLTTAKSTYKLRGVDGSTPIITFEYVRDTPTTTRMPTYTFTGAPRPCKTC